MSKSRDLGEFPAAALDIDASGNLDVTGTVTAEDVAVTGGSPTISMTDTDSNALFSINANSGVGSVTFDVDSNGVGANPQFVIQGQGVKRFNIDGNDGDISFYEDTGTTPKFFWDASAENLSLDSTGSYSLDISRNGGTDANTSIRFNQLSIDWYAGASGGNNFGIGTQANIDLAPVQITPAGYFGIGTSAPSRPLEITNATPGIRFTDTNAGDYGEIIAVDGSLIIRSDEGNTAAGSYMRFEIDGGEKVRIDSSGNVGIGSSTVRTKLDLVATTSATPTDFNSSTILLEETGVNKYAGLTFLGGNNTGSTGTVAKLLVQNTNTSGGFDGAMIFSTRNASSMLERMRIDSSGRLLVGTTTAPPFGSASFNQGIYVTTVVGDDLSGIYFGISGVYPAVGGGLSDNQIDLGNAAYRWDDVYATNGTIQTSDRNEKQDIEEITAAETAVATACKGLLRSFRWRDAVAEKGDDARVHFGIIAQDLQDAFIAEGLDAGRYAMFISGTSWETQTEVAAVEAVDEVTDKDGNVTTEAVEAKDAYTRTDTFEALAEAPEGATERTRLGVRYSELLAFIIAAI